MVHKWQLKKKNYGKIILENGDGGNRPNETAIEAWLLDYEKLMMNKDTTSQEAIYQVRSRIELPLRLIQPLRIDWWSTKYQFESHNSFWEHIQTLASFAIHTTPTQEFVVECDHSSDISGYRRKPYCRVKRSSTKNQLDRSIMLWSDVHSREKS